MRTFVKNIEKMSTRELRKELAATREIIDDIYMKTVPLTCEARKPDFVGAIERIRACCLREMPR